MAEDTPHGPEPSGVSSEVLRRAVLYLTDAMLVMTDALERVASRSSLGFEPSMSTLPKALKEAQRRLSSVVDLLAEKDVPGNG